MTQGGKENLLHLTKSSSEDKEKHLQICLEEDVETSRTTGFENYYLINDSLPEISFDDVDISCPFLGRHISAPIIISPITGGCLIAEKINKSLAIAAQKTGVVMSVGSQRIGIENPSLAFTYEVRDVAPDIPILANLGAIYLNYGYSIEECEKAVAMINADALTLYLNPMQRVFQGGENLDFRGIISKIAYICKNLSVPVIVKEVGFGLSTSVARRLFNVGVKMIDVAGVGGTSWVRITRKLNDMDEESKYFDDWGISTAEALVSILEHLRGVSVIASGGIRNGLQIAKAIALGADYVGIALPFLKPAMESAEAVENKIRNLMWELKTAMFCCGASNLDQLKKGNYIAKFSADSTHKCNLRG